MRFWLAVYGTLRRGQGNAGLLGDSVFIETRRMDGYAMYRCGGFPGIVESEEDSVVVEIYDASTALIPRLDQLEGHPSHFERVRKGGLTFYEYRQPVDRLPKVPSGDWCGPDGVRTNERS